MLPRDHRLHTARDYQDMWRSGRAFRGRYIVVRLRPKLKPEPRFGFVVSSSVAKRATDRNLVKRRLRTIAKKLSNRVTYDAVIYATKATITATYADLERDFHTIITSPSYATPTHRRH